MLENNNNNSDNNKKETKKKKITKRHIIGFIVGCICGFIALNILLPSVVADVINNIEDGIKNTIGISIDFNGDGVGSCVSHKPVIYIYGEYNNQDVKVRLLTDDKMICEYPKRDENDTWNVKADKDGTLHINNIDYNYLFWESQYDDINWDFSKGFCIKGTESREFLEWALDDIGLNRKEANEFIVYWLPKLEANEYNLISFQNNIYKERYKLDVEPYTDNILRVFMTYKKLDKEVNIEEQDLKNIKSDFKREGLHIVEWGGSEIY